VIFKNTEEKGKGVFSPSYKRETEFLKDSLCWWMKWLKLGFARTETSPGFGGRKRCLGLHNPRIFVTCPCGS